MRILDWTSLDQAGRRAALARPSRAARSGVETLARDVIAQVRRGGDAALNALTQRFDGAAPKTLAVTAEEFRAARCASVEAVFQSMTFIQTSIFSTGRTSSELAPAFFRLSSVSQNTFSRHTA